MKTKRFTKKLVLNKTTIIDLGKIKGGLESTGNCLSFIHITCPDPNCDFKSIPFDECPVAEPTCTLPCLCGGYPPCP